MKNEEKIEEEIYKKNINENELKLIDENEINDNNKVDKDLFLEIKSIHDYLDSKIKKDLNEIKNEDLKNDNYKNIINDKNNINENIINDKNNINENIINDKNIIDDKTNINNINILNENKLKENSSNDNIYIKYLKDPEIIFKKKDINNNNLKCLFNEIDYDIEKGNNIIFPFINVAENLVKAYIESNIDDEEDIERLSSLPETKDYQESESFYQKVFQKLKNNCFINKEIMISIYDYFSDLYHKFIDIKDDDILFKKLDKMIKLFKIFYEKNDNIENKNKSSICLLGTNLKIIFDDDIALSEGYKISIKINILNNYMNKIKDSEKLKLIKINDIELNYQSLNIKFEELKEIDFNIYPDSIYLESIGERKFYHKREANNKEIKEIFILENFYGQLSSIIVSVITNVNEIEYEFAPISIRNDNYIYYYKKYVKKIERIYNTPIIQINNISLAKINYINFNDDNFNIVDYFGGIIQFLPFYQIFKNIIELKTLNITEAITDLADFIIKIIVKQLFSTKNSLKLFKKYVLFVYYLLLDLDLVETFDVSVIVGDKFKKNELYYYIEFLQYLYYSQKNCISFNVITEVKEIIDNRESKEYTDLSFFNLPPINFMQLYKHYMRKLFIFNIFWSKKSIFFKNKVNPNKEEKFREVKYRQINYYTRNFQFPYFYPVLELREYYPYFSKCKGGIFLGFDNKIIKYNFELKPNKRAIDIINQLLTQKKAKKDVIYEKCCLIKNTHHIQGVLKFVKKNKNKNFKLIFKSSLEKSNEFCNKSEKKDKKTDNGDLLCYGSVFECPKREYSRKIIIKSNEILFILIRDYFHRVSAIEVFTLNKSYYFNFYNQFDINSIKKNKILNEIRSNPLFKEIKNKKDKLTLGFYKISYKAYLFPIFNDDISTWDNKIKFLCNYDILILINLFSNRSFRDVYQYPIFPTLYNWIKLERDMSKHIGLQDINEDSKKRKDIIIEFFKSNEEDCSDIDELCLFNIHYSNPAFVFNYLLRVLPYSFMAIEFQGDDFDNPNRLFYSIEKTLKSTLSLKSDLREMIPELFYMIEIYFNKNNLSFDKLYDGTEINYVQIYPPKEEEGKNKIINIVKFIGEMRKSLEKDKNINKWIDLIFGINQKDCSIDGKKYNYYLKYSEIKFKNDKKILNDDIRMKSIDFGLLPYQLFNKNFPIKKLYGEQKQFELNSFNMSLFDFEHIKEIKSPIESFICRGSIYVNDNYIKIIDKKEGINILENYGKIQDLSEKLEINKLNNYIIDNIFGSLNLRNVEFPDLGLINYYFIGNAFGEISIFSLIESKEENDQKNKDNNLSKKDYSYEECEGKKVIYNLINKLNNIPILNYNNKSVFTFGMKLIKKLNDHSKEIKYIDFNPRLNIFLSYSLDNFINVYIFPKLKLINIIDSDLFKDSDDKKYFDKVFLLSYPVPSIVCHNKENIYLLSINGEKIKYQKLRNNEKILIFIDKNLGLLPDKVDIVDSKDGKPLSTFNEIN